MSELSNQKAEIKLTLQDYKQRKMQDPNFAKAYDEVQPEMNVIRKMIDVGSSKNQRSK